MNQENSSGERQVIEHLQKIRQVPPRNVDAAQRGRANFLAEAEVLSQGVSNLTGQRHKGWLEQIQNKLQVLRKERFSMIATLTSIFVTVVLFFGGAGATAYAAQGALPGDALYSVKTASEQVRLALTAGNIGDAHLYNEFVQRRMTEMEALSDQGRYGDIPAAASRLEAQVRQAARILAAIAGEDPGQAQKLADRLRQSLALQVQIKNRVRSGQLEFEFLGIVEAIGIEAWTISDQLVAVNSQTRIQEEILIGDLVKVKALVEDDGSLTAGRIDLIENQGKHDFRLSGIIETMGEGTWVVAGRTVHITPQTKFGDSVNLGDYVRIDGVLTIDGSLVARLIRLADDTTGIGEGNENSNGNENGNGDDHGNENDNGNENENGNDNGDDHGNENDNGNGNENENDNGNDNGNGSHDGGGDSSEGKGGSSVVRGAVKAV